MQPIEQLEHILPTLCDTVDHIQAMQMNDATPCSEFTVHDVLNHMIVLGSTFAYAFRGEDAPDISPPGVYGWVPKAEFHTAMDGLLDAVKSPGAMERTISTPMGDVPGEAFARFVALDGLIHGWDLASSTGQEFPVPDAVTSAVHEFAHDALTADLRGSGAFEDPSMPPAGATQLEQLAAFSGRTV